jgi:drug/metabolite transporter (DMT)-like permease
VRTPIQGGIVVTLLSGVLWGTSFPVNKWGLQFIDPVTFVFGRLIISSILFAIIVKLVGWRLRWPWKTLAVLGSLNTGALLLQYMGQDLTTVTNAALLINTSALFVVIGGALFLEEPISREKLAGVLFGFFGAVLLTSRGDFTSLSAAGALGDLIIIISALLYTGYILINKRSLSFHNVDPLVLSAGVIWASTAAMAAPFLMLGMKARTLDMNLEALGVLSYTAVFNTIIPLYLWNVGLRRISATASTVLLMVEIIVATGLGVVFFGDTFTLPSALGALCLAFSFLMVSRESAYERIRY